MAISLLEKFWRLLSVSPHTSSKQQVNSNSDDVCLTYVHITTLSFSGFGMLKQRPPGFQKKICYRIIYPLLFCFLYKISEEPGKQKAFHAGRLQKGQLLSVLGSQAAIIQTSLKKFPVFHHQSGQFYCSLIKLLSCGVFPLYCSYFRLMKQLHPLHSSFSFKRGVSFGDNATLLAMKTQALSSQCR